MLPRLLHIYGPLWIHSYGVMIAVGFTVFLWLTYRHPTRVKLIPGEQYLNTVFLGLLSGIIGGRLLFVITEWEHFLHNPLKIISPWEGGFVVLGGIIGILAVIPAYLVYHKVKTLEFLDFVSQYAPLMQAIARFGCLFAGCCYGKIAADLPWAITFTNPDGFAPINLPLHPTQLYLALASFCIFLALPLFKKIVAPKPGQLTFIYLILESISRFTLDFWRGDHDCGNCIHEIPFDAFGINARFMLSTMQLYSLVFFIVCIIGLVIVSVKSNKQNEREF